MSDLSVDKDCAVNVPDAAPRAFVILLLICLCLTRPAFFGQDFNLIGGLGLIAITVGYLLSRSASPVIVPRSSAALNTTVALLVFWSYSLGSTVFFSDSYLALLFKACAGSFGVAICFLLLSSNGDLVNRTFSAFARLNSGLGYSIAVTSCLLPIVGYSGLRISSYAIGGYDDVTGVNGDILLPFSVVYGDLMEYGIYRYCGIYREAGIAQAFFVWSAVYLMYSRAPRIWVFGSLLGATLCASTAVVFSLGAVAVAHFGSRSRYRPKELLLLMCLLGLLVTVAIFTPGLGLEDKGISHAASISDRQEAMALALPHGDIWRWLFGNGLFYNLGASQNLGINAISLVFSVGVLGFTLYLATFFAGVFGSHSYVNASRYITLISPFLVTSLLFQPLVDAPIVLALLFSRPPPVGKS